MHTVKYFNLIWVMWFPSRLHRWSEGCWSDWSKPVMSVCPSRWGFLWPRPLSAWISRCKLFYWQVAPCSWSLGDLCTQIFLWLMLLGYMERLTNWPYLRSSFCLWGKRSTTELQLLCWVHHCWASMVCMVSVSTACILWYSVPLLGN